MAGKLYEQFDQYWLTVTTQWQRLTTLHRAFVLSGLVFLLSCVAALPGLLTIYFLSILSALAIAKTLNESNSFQPSDSLLKYVYFLYNFYFQRLSYLQRHWKKRSDQLPDAAEKHKTSRNLQKNDAFEIHSRSSSDNQLHVTNSESLIQFSSLPHEEMLLFKTHIFNDFILSWYTHLSLHQQVPDEFLMHLTYLCQSFTSHSKKIDVHRTVNCILFELRKHINQFRTSSLKLKQLPLNSRSTLAEVYGHYFDLHPAIQDQRFMEDYLRQVTNVLMWCLFPSHVYRCYTGNLLLQEILTCNVFISLADLLSDPNTLNDIILLLIDDKASMPSELEGGVLASSEEKHLGKVTEVEHGSSDLKVCQILNNQAVTPKEKTSLPVDGDDDDKFEGEELKNDCSGSDDQKVWQTSPVACSRPMSLDLIDTKELQAHSLPSQQDFPSSPTKSTLYRCKSSPIISVPVQSTFQAKNKSGSYVVPITELAPSMPLKKRPSLTSLVSFQSIPADEEDAELWLLDGEENAQDSFAISKDPGNLNNRNKVSGTQDDQLVMYGRPKPDEGFASDTLKMLHGMVDTALSKLPSMEANPTEKKDEGDSVFINLMENLQHWKTSFEDDILDEKDQIAHQNKPCGEITSSNGLVLPEDEQSNWGHDFVNEQEKKMPSMSGTQHKNILHQKKDGKHCNSVAISHQPDDDSKSRQKTAAQKRAMYGLSRSKTLAVLEGLTTEDTDVKKERSVWIQSMLIKDTETMKDLRNISKDYTLYSIKYQALIWKGDEQPTEPETHWLKRRFREFTNLQSRLEENPRLKPLLKGIKDVPRKLQLVNRMNEDVVLHRKQSLERYLQNLCSIPAICSSTEFQEFIALEGDKHIEYVKKAPEIVPRIDKDSYIDELEKFFLRSMSGIMGTLKSKLPSSSTLPASPALTGIDHDDSSQQGDSTPESSTSPFAELENDGPQRSYVFRTRDSSVERNVDVLLKSFLESRVTGTSIDQDQETTHEDTQQESNIKSTSEARQAEFKDVEGDKKELNYTEIPLAHAVMCLSCEVLHDYGNWVVKETTQQVVAVAFGKLLNKLLEDTVDVLVTEDMCARYLKLIRQLLWPNGQLLSQQNPPKTDEEKEKARRNAFQRVKDLTPGIVTQAIGEEELENCLLFIHASLQDPKLNRHLVFTLIDILLDALIAEIQDPNIREKLIQEAVL